MVTLHSYVLRELLKTFGLALATLTVLFTMGGGLYNVVRYEGVSAADVFGFLPLLIPIVITLTMPMAALFAATMVYGRLAADNELTACRAAGINIHRLFLSAILLSIFVAAFSLLLGSFVIPGSMQRLENFARNNLRDLVAQQLQYKGFIHRGRNDEDRYTITAERVQGVTDTALREKQFEVAPGLNYLLITNATFLQVDKAGDLARFAVAEHVLCAFDTRVSPLEVTIHVQHGQDFEVGKRASEIGQQQLGPMAVPLPAPFRLTTADLGSLFYWRRAPWDCPRLKNELQGFLGDLTRQCFGSYAADSLRDGKSLRLRDEYDQEFRVTAASFEPGRNGLTLTKARVEVHSPKQAAPTRYEAERLDLVPLPAPTGKPLIEMRLAQTAGQDVLEFRPLGKTYGEPRHKDKLTLDRITMPDEVLCDVAGFTPAMVLDTKVPIETNPQLGDRRISLQKSAARLDRQLVATINFRLGYTTSVLVTLLMGAALGVLFRGARALAAFALSLVPFFCVLIVLVLARQLTEDEHAFGIGPLVTWGGLVLVLLSDGAMLRLGVRR
jgi:lipopolysaccharide export LptBFGC system permease protein LptF